jgi:hypothetical protein
MNTASTLSRATTSWHRGSLQSRLDWSGSSSPPTLRPPAGLPSQPVPCGRECMVLPPGPRGHGCNGILSAMGISAVRSQSYMTVAARLPGIVASRASFGHLGHAGTIRGPSASDCACYSSSVQNTDSRGNRGDIATHRGM